jgi:hypothetical protein
MNLSLRDILAGGVGHWLSKQQKILKLENIQPPTSNAEVIRCRVLNVECSMFPTTPEW